MAPVVLVTLGVLFLLANLSGYPFERTWPILLIVIGVIRVVGYAMPESGHVTPGPYPPPDAAAGQQCPPPYQGGFANGGPAAHGPVVTPPPAPVAGALGDGNSERNAEHGEVHNG